MLSIIVRRRILTYGLSLRALVSYLSIAIALFISTVASAAPQNYLQNPIFLKMLDELEKEEQFNRQDLITLFEQVKRQDSILEAMSRPAEKTKTWGEYKPIFVNETGIKKGVEFWIEHKDTLEKAAREYNVPEAMIVAIIGVETRYGSYKGKYKVIEALSTLAFDYPPRSEFFYKQLKQYLVLTRKYQWDPMSLLGSYAGAMGYAQFIPSSYLNLAVDYDGDDIPDLINSAEDAIGSIANYFNHHGWAPNKPVLLTAKKVKTDNDEMTAILNTPLEPTTTLETAAKAGLILHPAVDGDFLVRPFTFINKDEQEELWFGLNNFFVITEYNHSKLYARAAYELASAIEKQYTRKASLSIKEDSQR